MLGSLKITIGVWGQKMTAAQRCVFEFCDWYMRVKKHHHTPMGIFKLPRLFRWRQMATKRCLDHIWRVNRNSLWIIWNQKWTFGEEGEVDIWRRKFWRKFANFWTNVGGRSPAFGASRIPAPRVHSSKIILCGEYCWSIVCGKIHPV